MYRDAGLFSEKFALQSLVLFKHTSHTLKKTLEASYRTAVEETVNYGRSPSLAMASLLDVALRRPETH